ncbi:hypothetical protein [Spirulina sp. 06S082]|uniref:hypothetical protein n=1 Tax=Spirulina sp. 06S082 TaxID=3110248 RepID=UPI002B21B8A0|nr:hypothetical protein [Spirulina sp. 06S082]MEA5470608.1 hypothetical protein [Spirulina sp. 06S082]
MNIDAPEFMEYFLDFSIVATGFSRFDLLGTGQTSLYFDTVRGIIGGEMFAELLQIFHDRGLDPILVSPKLGPIARNIIKLWYIATWEELSPIWHEMFGAGLNDATFIVAPYAYPEGLLWKTIGVNPPAAKPPGYGTWSAPPVSIAPAAKPS